MHHKNPAILTSSPFLSVRWKSCQIDQRFVLFITGGFFNKLFLYQSLYYPTNAHNVKNIELLKHIKIMESAETCFSLQRNHHRAATAST